MTYPIIGFGSIGQALAKAFARNGIDVAVATTRDPDSFAADAAAIGPTIIPKPSWKPSRRTSSFSLFVSRGPDVGQALPSWQGKTVVDAMNSNLPLEEMNGLLSSVFVTQAFSGAKLVKGWNHLLAATLATDPVVEGGHRVVFLSSNEADAIPPVAALAKRLGFAPVDLGRLDEGGALVHARGRIWGQLIFKDLFKKEQ